VIEGYGPNNLLDRLTSNGWKLSRSKLRHFHGILADGNAVLIDRPLEHYFVHYRITVDTVPPARTPVIVEGWQSRQFPAACKERVRLDGVTLRSLAYQEIDSNVTAYRVTLETL
jgi:hypothetical protein